jgi:hypothetical protein
MGGTLTSGRVASCGPGEYYLLPCGWGCGKRVAGGVGRLGTLLGPEGTSTAWWRVALLLGTGCRCTERPVVRISVRFVVWVRGGSDGRDPSVL